MRRGWVLLAALAAAAAASEDAWGDARLVGLNIHQSADVGVAVTEGCKGGIVRVDFNWYAAEPSEGTYDWSVLDAVVNASVAKGFVVIATTGYTPPWAGTSGEDDTMYNAVPVAGSYAAFVTAAVTHFAGRVSYWELWNEPNLPQFFQGTAEQYVDLVVSPGAAAVHAACPACKVLAPTVATVGSNYADWMATVLLLAGPSVDIVTGHDYAEFDDMGAGGATSPDFFSKLDKHRVITVGGKIVYEDPLSLRESMDRYGASAKSLWITETGYQAAYGDVDAMATQAHYATEVLGAMVARPWWGATVFYEAFDVAGQPYHWGFSLADPDASAGYEPKPVCSVLANPPDWDAALPPDAGAESGAGSDAANDSGTVPEAGSPPDASNHPANQYSGCGCRVASDDVGSSPILAIGALLLALGRRGLGRGANAVDSLHCGGSHGVG
jgi:hypothetical protein